MQNLIQQVGVGPKFACPTSFQVMEDVLVWTPHFIRKNLECIPEINKILILRLGDHEQQRLGSLTEMPQASGQLVSLGEASKQWNEWGQPVPSYTVCCHRERRAQQSPNLLILQEKPEIRFVGKLSPYFNIHNWFLKALCMLNKPVWPLDRQFVAFGSHTTSSLSTAHNREGTGTLTLQSLGLGCIVHLSTSLLEKLWRGAYE